ncbi:MAG: two component transcriptional regulator, LuxR family, partial [Dehalococcoidia bacterium]|nr:two component transcriptional regulator, LuxR family [Dehalococcoidia bacterium]
INMPGMGGLEATRLLKAQMPEIKVVILTVSDDSEDLFEAIKSGADGYLVKDLASEEFFDLIAGLSRGESPITRDLATKILEEFARRARAPSELPQHQVLTGREVDVLRLVAAGKHNKEVAAMLFISGNTVKFHLSHILEKLHLQNRSQVVAWALRHGVTSPEETK